MELQVEQWPAWPASFYIQNIYLKPDTMLCKRELPENTA